MRNVRPYYRMDVKPAVSRLRNVPIVGDCPLGDLCAPEENRDHHQREDCRLRMQLVFRCSVPV